MFNITKSFSLSLPNIIKYHNTEKFKYNNYLTIFVFKLLLFRIVVNNLFDKNEKIFNYKYLILEGLLL